MNKELHFSSGKDDWETPLELFTRLHTEFDFTVDAAADQYNRKCERWYGPGSLSFPDALAFDWDVKERYWLNPPYSRGLQAKFVAKAVDVAKRGGLVVALLPSRTDTRLFHNYIWDKTKHQPRPWVKSLRFVSGRVRFVGASASAPFPSMIVVFHV